MLIVRIQCPVMDANGKFKERERNGSIVYEEVRMKFRLTEDHGPRPADKGITRCLRTRYELRSMV